MPNVKGLVSFAGGVRESDCTTPDKSLAAAAGELGASTTTPSIWFFGDNDQIFPVATWRAMYEQYRKAGGPAELVAYGAFMQNSHELLAYPEGLRIWEPKVDAFLARIGMPNKPVHPEYLPMASPPPSHYAFIDDVASFPFNNDKAHAFYQNFLTKPLPRAIAIGQNGGVAASNGGFDPLRRALADCGKAALNCRLYAVDNDVVWTRPTLPPPPSHFAAIDDVASFPFDNQGRAAYQTFLTKPLPRAIAVGPNGRISFSSGGFDPLAEALANCGKNAPTCRLYAVDNDVVWVRPTPPPPPSRFADLADVNAPPFLGGDGRDGYRKFLALAKPRAFAIAPDGVWVGATGGFDPLARALALCGQRHQGCRLYAVDENVVWAPGADKQGSISR
jgi:hypothetical protein